MKKISTIVASLLLTLTAGAQDRSNVYTNLLNPFLYNPALAGSADAIYTVFNARSIVGGMDGSARSYNFAIHAPVGNGNALGAKMISASVGAFQTMNAEAAYSKLVKMNEDHSISFGLSLGFTQTNIKSELLNGQVDLSDPTIMSKDLNRLLLSSGAGAMYRYKKKAELGIAFPALITGDHPLNDMMVANAAWNFFPGKNHEWRVRPMVNYYNLKSSPSMMDVMLGASWNEAITLSAGYRTNGAVIAGAGLSLKSLSVHYAYYYHTAELMKLAPAQNEIAIAFMFNKRKQ